MNCAFKSILRQATLAISACLSKGIIRVGCSATQHISLKFSIYMVHLGVYTRRLIYMSARLGVKPSQSVILHRNCFCLVLDCIYCKVPELFE